MTMGRRGFLAGGLAVSSGAVPQDPSPPLRVGVLRVRACFDKDKYARIPEILQELSRLRESLAADAEGLRRKAEAAARAAEDLTGKPNLQMERLRQRGQAEGELKVVQEAGRRRLIETAHELDGRVLREIRRVTALVAKDRGLQLVFRADDSRTPMEAPEASPASSSDRATVLFHAPELDLTPPVIERLNVEWSRAWSCATCKRKVTEDPCPDCPPRRP